MIDDFKKYLKKDKKSLKTIQLYIKSIEEFMEWYLLKYTCNFKLLKRKDVIEFEEYLKNNKAYKSVTIKVKLSGIAKFNEFLIYSNIQNKMVV